MPRSFTYAGLFSGVGMMEYAAEQLGGTPAFMCEMEPFCQRILRRRFPGVPLIGDVKTVRGADWKLIVDLLIGGFPCQDISSAGKGAGIKGARSGLWKEFFRVISEMRPKMVLIENVAVLRSRGLDVVLYDLWSIGYHAEWDVISAAAVGAPHLRERIWIVARPAELAQEPIYGSVARDKKAQPKTFSLVVKMPRAGRMGEELHELQPLAPRKTKRKDGWSYWDGVNLFAGRLVADDGRREHQGPLLPYPTSTMGGRGDLIQVVRGNESPSGHFSTGDSRMLWPSSSSRDWKDTGDLNCVPDKSLLPRRVFHVEQGTALWPTAVASVAQGGERTETWFARRERLKITANNGNGAGIPLTIAVLADAEGKRQWPTPSAMSENQGPGRSGREGGDNLVTRVNGSLSPCWVEWLMGMPLWWTDPTVPNDLTILVGWDDEPLHVAPRTEKGIALRAARLRACGNSIVWPCAFYVLSCALDATPEVYSMSTEALAA